MIGQYFDKKLVNSGLPYTQIADACCHLTSTTAAVAGTWDTYRTMHRNRSGKALSGIILVYGNYLQVGTTEGITGLAQIQVKAAFQRNGSSVSDQTGERILAKFNGQLTGFIDPGSVVESTFLPVDIGVGETFYILSAVTPTSGVVRPWGNRDTYGGTANAGRNTGEGQSIGTDTTASGTVTIGTNNKNFCPVAILGLAVDGSIIPAVAIYGDSITGGSNDAGYGRDAGGWAERGFGGYTGTWGQTGNTYYCPFMKLAYGGESSSNFQSLNNLRVRQKLAGYATHEVHAHGTNDLGDANLQTYMLNAAVRAMVAGRRVIRCTILPRATSTGGFKVASDQSTAAAEGGAGGRSTVNSWMRDTSASGFVAQAVAAARARNPKAASCRVLDLCSPIEVNSAGVLTANGTFFLPDTGAVLTGTAGVGTTVNQLVTTMTVTIDQYRGYAVRRPANNEIQTIWYHPASVGAGTFQFRSSFAAFASGDSYEIYLPPIADGVNGSTHLSSAGHRTIADWVNPQVPNLLSFW